MVTRLLFALGSLLAAGALVLHLSTWYARGVMNWPAFCNMLGLLVLTMTGAIDPPRGRLRRTLSLVAIGLIFPSAVLLLLR